MAKHEFGIMMDAPQQGTRYDEYEPWKYTCISVDDAHWIFLYDEIALPEIWKSDVRKWKSPVRLHLKKTAKGRNILRRRCEKPFLFIFKERRMAANQSPETCIEIRPIIMK